MLLSEMSPEDAANEIIKTEKIHRHGITTEEEYAERVQYVKDCITRIIKFIRNAKIISTDLRANRGKKSGSIESSKYPGVYVHQIIVISDGSHKFEVNHPEGIANPDYADPTRISLNGTMFRLWNKNEVEVSFNAKSKMLKASPELYSLYREAIAIRSQFDKATAEEMAEAYVQKTQGKAKAGIAKKLGSFLAEYNLKDEDPEFLLQIMKFISRDNFWEMKNFFNYCRRNVGDINFLTTEEIIQAQNLAKAIEVTKS